MRLRNPNFSRFDSVRTRVLCGKLFTRSLDAGRPLAVFLVRAITHMLDVGEKTRFGGCSKNEQLVDVRNWQVQVSIWLTEVKFRLKFVTWLLYTSSKVNCGTYYQIHVRLALFWRILYFNLLMLFYVFFLFHSTFVEFIKRIHSYLF